MTDPTQIKAEATWRRRGACLLPGLILAAFVIGASRVIHPVVQRYLSDQPASMAICLLFCLSLSTWWFAWRHARFNHWVLDSLRPGAIGPHTLLTEHASVGSRARAWTEHLDKLPKEAQSSLLLLRLREILSRLARRGDTQLMNEDLRELAQRDSRAMEESLGLVRAAIWVLPLLGVLGMLYRIASVLQVVSGLGSDFAPSLVMGISYGLDCLVLALACSVVNILALGPAHHAQRQLVARLDCLLDQLILPMFPKQTGAAGAVDSAALGEMMERMLDAIEHTARVQTDVWQQAMVTAQRHWQLTVETAGDQVQAALREAIEASLMKHAAEVDRAQHAGIEAIDRRWRQWQNVLSDNARALTTQQKLLTEHGEYLKAATERSEELSTLREALNQNLVAVEQTLKTLGGTQELASAMRTLGRAVELMAVNTQAIVAASPASATRNRAAA